MRTSPTNDSRRRREIRAIAADLFAERGFARVTVDEIGEAAGVSGPALYHHFDSKEALLGEMLVGISQHLYDGGRRISASDADPLATLIHFHCEFAVDNRSLITVHFRDLIHAANDDRRRVRHLQGRYVTLWTEALVVHTAGRASRSSRAAVNAAFGLINSTPHTTTLGRGEMIAMLESMALGALGSVEDA